MIPLVLQLVLLSKKCENIVKKVKNSRKQLLTFEALKKKLHEHLRGGGNRIPSTIDIWYIK